MRIIIVGGGMVGTQLAHHLIDEKHDVSLIEKNEERARHASNRLDCLVINDEANNASVLEAAGIAKADALICVTDSDELNMIVCGLAEAKYPKLLKIARVRNSDYDNLVETGNRTLGIDYFVHPDIEAAKSVLNAIDHGALGDVLAFGDTSFEIGSFEISKKSLFANHQVKDFNTLSGVESLVTLIERGDESILPNGLSSLLPGDRLHVMAKEKELSHIFEVAGKIAKPLNKIGVVGGSKVAIQIIEGLLENTKPEKKRFSILSLLKVFKPKSTRKIVIIEKDYAKCKELSSRFPHAVVLNEDISDESFVVEEGLNDLDLIVTATDNQELNMIAALYLKSRGVNKAIALVSGSGYVAIARRLGIDVVIPMKSVVVDSILSHLLGEGVKGVHRLGDVGVLELEVIVGNSLIGKRLSTVKFQSGCLMILAKRNGQAFLPRGDYEFTVGDTVVILVKKGGETEINKIFSTIV